LNLGNNRIGAEGARHLSQALQHNAVIFHLLHHSYTIQHIFSIS